MCGGRKNRDLHINKKLNSTQHTYHMCEDDLLPQGGATSK
jgi:hypothetical protein